MSGSNTQHLNGKPENILKFSANNKVESNLDPITKLFTHNNVKDRKIVVFSIIGAYRKGKSFFLDYCLRFMYANYSSINCPNSYSSDWMGEKDEPLAGFSWRSGSIRDTTGIIIWNDIFLHTDDDTDEKIAIVIMDTQGLFDNETSPMDNSRIFALGTLISSIQVLNLSGVVQEDQLQYLQFATEFAKLAAKNCHSVDEKPFHNLTFLIRDWQNNDEYPFGVEGGEEYLSKILQIRSNQSQDLKSVRRFIQTSFEELSCSLLPYPGRTVAEGVRKGLKYNGSWGGMNDDFKDELEKTIEFLLEPEKMIKWIKKINRKCVNGNEFLEYIELYFKLMESDQLLKVQSIYETLIEKEMNIVVDSCVQKYMEIVSKNKKVIQSVEHIATIHESSKSQATCIYIEAKKMGDTSHETKFRQILDQRIEFNYEYWRKEVEQNIRKVEREKKKIEQDSANKLKLEQQKLECQKQRMEEYHKKESRKWQAKQKEEKRKNEKEILDLKVQLENERKAREEQFKREKHQLTVDKIAIEMKYNLEIKELKNKMDAQKKEQEIKLQKVKNEFEQMKHKQELEEIRREMDERIMELQKMKDKFEARKQSVADEVLKAKEQAEKERKDAELKLLNYDGQSGNAEIRQLHNQPKTKFCIQKRKRITCDNTTAQF